MKEVLKKIDLPVSTQISLARLTEYEAIGHNFYSNVGLINYLICDLYD